MSKFYGIAKINTRGQIVIPKDARSDYFIDPGDNLVLLKGVLPHSKDAMLLMRAEEWYKIPEDAPIKDKNKHIYVDILKIAERGQIVIPKKLRDELAITDGTQILILSHEKTKSIILAILNSNRIGEWAENLVS